MLTHCEDQGTAVSFCFWAGGIVFADEERSNGASSGIGEGCVWNITVGDSIISGGDFILLGSLIVVKTQQEGDETRMVL